MRYSHYEQNHDKQDRYKQYHYKRDHRSYCYDDQSDAGKRSKASSKIMGVCAGVADQFGWDVTGVRVVALLGLIFLSVPTFLAYLIAGIIFY